MVPDDGWQSGALCHGQTGIFFAPSGERPEARARREAKARLVCDACPVIEACRAWGREYREYGYWGGESEDDRARAGFRADLSRGRMTGQFGSGRFVRSA